MAAPAARPWPWAVFDYIGEASTAVISGAVQCPEVV